MRERVPMTDFARQWAEHVAASASPRMTDDQAERDFWHAFMARKTYAPEPSALQVLERLRPLLRAAGTISPPSMPSGRRSRRSGGTIWFSAITASTGRRIWPTASGGWTGQRTSCAWRA